MEEVLRKAQDPPWEAVLRMTIGFLLLPIVAVWHDGRAGGGGLLLGFLLVLIMLRVLPAVARRVIPFSADLQQHWFMRRQLAKRYDSYQWQKLFWFGIGLTIYLLLFDDRGTVEMLLASACLVGGGLGVLLWRRVARDGQASCQP
jgi:hypothetical protein